MIMQAGLWVFVGKLGSQAARFVLVIVLARLLTPEAFGIVAAAQVIIALSDVVVRFGIGAALIQSEKVSERMERTALTMMTMTTVVICCVLLAISSPLARFMQVPELVEIMPVLLVTFSAAALANPSTSLIARDMNFRFLASVNVGTYIFGYGLIAVVLALLGFSYWSLILGSMVQSVALAVLVFRRRPIKLRPLIAREEARHLLYFGGGVFLSQSMSTAARRLDNVLVSAIFGPASLGFYSRAYALMDMTNSLLGSVFRETLFSGFSKKRREGKSGTTEIDAFLMAHAFAALIILPISAMMFILANELVFVLLGDQWAPVVPLLEVLALGMYFRLAYKVSNTFNVAAGKVYYTAALNTIYAAVVVGFSYVLAKMMGDPVGVAYAVLLALVLHTILMTRRATRELSLDVRRLFWSLRPYMIASAVGSLAVIAVRVFYGEGAKSEETLVSLISAVLWVACYAAVLVLFRNDPTFSGVMSRLKGFLHRIRSSKNGKTKP